MTSIGSSTLADSVEKAAAAMVRAHKFNSACLTASLTTEDMETSSLADARARDCIDTGSASRRVGEKNEVSSTLDSTGARFSGGTLETVADAFLLRGAALTTLTMVGANAGTVSSETISPCSGQGLADLAVVEINGGEDGIATRGSGDSDTSTTGMLVVGSPARGLMTIGLFSGRGVGAGRFLTGIGARRSTDGGGVRLFPVSGRYSSERNLLMLADGVCARAFLMYSIASA